MTVEIQEESPAALAQYASVSIAFEVREILAVRPREEGLGGLEFATQGIAAPYVKDYDGESANHPSRWPVRFDLTSWGILAARSRGARVGGAVIAWGDSAVEMLEGQSDLAVLWDLRVAPDARGRGIGTALFQAAERWSVLRGASRLKVETQNTNVAACRFYVRQGCTLGAVHRFAYPLLPDEVQFLWYKKLLAGAG